MWRLNLTAARPCDTMGEVIAALRSKQMYKVGERIVKTMGVQLAGTVSRPISPSKWNDGSYRLPFENETPVYVIWDDKTCGWIDQAFLKSYK